MDDLSILAFMRFFHVIDLWPSAKVLAEDIGENTATVHKWRQRDSIPGDQWLAIVAAGGRRGYDVSLASLAQIASGQPVEAPAA